MEHTTKNTAQRGAAVAAGISLLIMAAAAALCYGWIHGTIVIPDNPAATAANLRSSSALFKAEIFGWLVILICDAAAAWALYLFFEPVHRGLSLLGAWLRLAYTAMLGTAVAALAAALLLSDRGDALSAPGLNDSLILLSLDLFDFVWSIGLVVFGLHLLTLGLLALRAASLPRWIGFLLLLASVGYAAVHSLRILLPEGNDAVSLLETVLAAPMAAGELGLALWLLARGGRQPALQAPKRSEAFS
ncbi:DUF4386 domain-containing protein [Saccharibacillus deserti]|uniref:DUF4386 domain-containing protein n=1 Tax=Saccharibacillus deserti TaxID=1634444 RepID=UPI001555B2AF|nr:DUF4386 domain-containing protein [Saccharibacillus deserti]